MRLLITGSREFTNYEKVKRVLEQLEPTVLIVGDCRGVDTLALKAAKELGIKIDNDGPHKADWARYPRGGGAIRNKAMLKREPDTVAAIFDNSKCTGTGLMVQLASDAGIPVLEFILKGN